jgi:peptide/nickel transport system substrate-binding protein
LPSTQASAAPSVTAAARATSAAINLASSYEAVPATTVGGKVVLAEWEFPQTVNPYYAMTETDIEASGSMFDSLLNVTPDLKYVPDLATNIPTLDNGGVVLNGGGMDVTWKLRPGMEWSDGKPIDCADITATWQWVMDKDNSGLAAGTIGWQDLTGVDGGTGTDCVMHFGKVYEGYLTLVSPLLPAHYITTIPVRSAASQLYPMNSLASGVYSGPYIPVSVDGHAKMTLKPNPHWETIGGHAPWLASVTWKYYGDAGTMIAGFEKGEFDVGQNLDNTNIPALTAIDASRKVVDPSLTYELLAFNNASFQTKFGADAANIVLAIKLATDRAAIASGPMNGNVIVSNNSVSPLDWYYTRIDRPTTADPTTAFTLLANAGWIKGPDGYVTKRGKPLELTYCTTNNRQFRLDTFTLMAAQLKQIGIKVDVNVKPDLFGTWATTKPDTQCNLRHGNFDVAEFAYVSRFDPLTGYRIYDSSQIPDATHPYGENISRASVPALDAAYDTVATNVDFTKVRDAMYAVQNLYGSDRNTYELPLYFRKDVWLVNPKLHNFDGNPTSSAAEWNIGDWWVG